MILVDLLPYIGLLLLTVLVPLFVKNKKTYMFFLFLLFFVFCGFRYGVGWDYFNYANTIKNGGWRIERTEFLVRQLNIFCENHGYAQFFFVATSFFIILLFFLMFYLDSRAPVISVFVFLCIPTFFLNSLVLIRYFMAVSAVFLSLHFGYKKQYIPYFALLLVAFLCHRASVFGLITVPFVLLKKEFSFKTNLILFITCFVLGTVVGSFSLFSSVFSFFADTSLFGELFESGEQYVQDTGGANFSKTPYVFALINLINLFTFHKNNQNESAPLLGHYVTMYNIGCSLMFLLSFNAIFANRLSLFFTIFLTLIVPFYKKNTLPQAALYTIFLFVFFYELTIKASHPLFIGRQNCWLPYTMNFSF